MSAITQLLSVARAYAASEAVGLTTVSWRVFGDSKKLGALADGADIQTRRLEQAMAWLSTHWPAAAAWPDGVTRPERAKDAGGDATELNHGGIKRAGAGAVTRKHQGEFQ